MMTAGGHDPADSEPASNRIERVRSAIGDGTVMVDAVILADAILASWRMDDVVQAWHDDQVVSVDEAIDDSSS